MNFKLKADTICIIRFALEELYYSPQTQTAAAALSRPTLFELTKKFTNKQLRLYKQLPIDDKKRHKMTFEIHEIVLLKNILLKIMQDTDNIYSAALLRQFFDEIKF